MAATDVIKQIIYNTCIERGLPPTAAMIIVGQAKNESGNFSSNVFKTDNNLFGMKMPSKRPHPYIARPSTIVMKSEGSTPYAHYNSIADSVNDLIDWHKYNRTDWSKMTTPEAYVNWIKSKGYYQGSTADYIKIISDFLRKSGVMKYAKNPVFLIIIVVGIYLLLNSKK